MKVLAGVVAAAAMLVAPFSFAQDAPQNLGANGESCRARSDCRAGLRCVNQVCTDNAAATPSKAGSDDWMKFNPLDGNVHPFAGIVLAGGFDTGGVTGNFSAFFNNNFKTFDGSFLFALNGGAFFGNHQLSFEIAPVTFVYDGKANGPVFEMVASYAYFIPLTESGDIHVYWPIRVGVGMAAGPDNNAFGFAFFQARADLIGAAIQIGHAIIDLHLPSFRYAITDKSGTQLHLLDWLFGMSVGYAF